MRKLPTHIMVALEKSATAKVSPRRAIKLKCYECCGFEDYMERSKTCNIQRCPLWAYRPGTSTGRKKKIKKAAGSEG